MKPHLKVSGCIAKAEAAFLARMEDILDVYAQPHDQQYPVVCFDERPCFLIADTIAPIPTQEGRIAKEHYSYEKNGSCCLLAAIEPKQGKRVAAVYEQRTKKEYTQSSCRHWCKAIRKQRRSSWCRITKTRTRLLLFMSTWQRMRQRHWLSASGSTTRRKALPG